MIPTQLIIPNAHLLPNDVYFDITNALHKACIDYLIVEDC